MRIIKRVLVICGLVMTVVANPLATDKDDISDCLEKDSISCVQLAMYRHLRGYFDQPSTPLFGGLTLEHGTALTPSHSGQAVEMARSVSEREVALETFLAERISAFVTGSQFKWNLAPVIDHLAEGARALAEKTPPSVKEWFGSLEDDEGRARRRRKMAMLLPILLAGKMKFTALLSIGYLAIAFLAKKAILAGLLSIIISVLIGLKRLLWHDESSGFHGYSAPSTFDWARKSDQRGDDTLAYGAHAPSSR